jgi:hypothetical protein
MRQAIARVSALKAAPGATVEPEVADVVATLERLNSLRASGAITDPEFESLKSQALTAKEAPRDK